MRLCGHAAARAVRPDDVCAGAAEVRHRGAEAALPAAHLPWRRLLVPGLFGAGVGLGPRIAFAPAPYATATTTSSTARRPGPRSRIWPTGSSAWCAPTPALGTPAGRHLVPAHRHENARHHRAPADPDGRRPARSTRCSSTTSRVPVENRVHDEGKGWTVAKYLLGHERMNTARIGASQRELEKLKAFAARQQKDGRPLLEDPRFRDKVTRVEVELIALSITNLRFLDQLRGGQRAGRGGVDAEDQGHRDPAGADRAHDAGRGPAGAAASRPASAGDGLRRRSPRRSRRATATTARPRSTPARTRSSATSSPRWRSGCRHSA